MTPSQRYKEAVDAATTKADKADKQAPEASREEVSALFDIARTRAKELVCWHMNGRK